MKFRKKPVVIEAVQFTSERLEACCRFIGREHIGSASPDHIEILTLEGSLSARLGDWIIKGVKGEFYPCKADIFEATYEPGLLASGDEDAAHVYGVAPKRAPLLACVCPVCGIEATPGPNHPWQEGCACRVFGQGWPSGRRSNH